MSWVHCCGAICNEDADLPIGPTQRCPICSKNITIAVTLTPELNAANMIGGLNAVRAILQTIPEIACHVPEADSGNRTMTLRILPESTDRRYHGASTWPLPQVRWVPWPR